MNFLEFLSFAPLTISFITIVIILAVVCFASYYFLKVVNYCLNSEAWGGEVIEPILISSLVTNFFVKGSEEWAIVSYNKMYHKLRRYSNFWVYENTDGNYKTYLKTNTWGDVRYESEIELAKTFKTKEEAITWAKSEDDISNVSELTSRIPVKMYLLIPVIDLCLWTFTLAPLATLSITLTATTVFSIRWVSGRLAENVNKTKDNTSRIDDLEAKNEIKEGK